ncbi:extended synaptotagmin-2-A-like isoform X2 [Conger conger]|uniref:extended synaptotagmin-2-A-like isoform X2 n=1 Tax=Conger conger TaxID=82655 RepID=UPI002A5A7B3C|nr:extended synaptotagmin-2-A-like isoform X2 [Conger conger]
MSGEATTASLGPDSSGIPREKGRNAPVDPKTNVQAPADFDDESDSSLTDVKQMWIRFAKTFGFLLPIYILGYFEFSFSWILIGLAAFFWWKRNKGSKQDRISRAFAFLEEEDRATRQSVTTADLPPWVHFPDVERVEWLNKTVKQMWPYICQFVDKLFRETIEPAVKGANPHLSSFCFSKIDMGDKPLRVNGVKVYTENVDKRQIIMDLQISFVGNTEIDCDIKKYYCRAGIKSIQLHGVLRVIMDPLLGDMPLIGAVSVFFLKKPLLDINWTGLTNMLDIPGLNGLCDNLIQDIIYGYLVLPNRITIPLVGEAKMAQLRFPVPKSVLRVHFLEAQELEAKDKFMGGMIKGKSDPYGVLEIGNVLFQSKTIMESTHPRWNEVYEFLVYEHSGQHLKIELFDEDTDKDDFLGSLMLDLAELHKEQKVDKWFELGQTSTGKVHLKLESLSLLSSPDMLDEATQGCLSSDTRQASKYKTLMSIKADKGQANDGLSSALLFVFLDSARNLPRNPLECNHEGLKKSSVSKALKSGKKVSSDPNPFVQMSVGHKMYESRTRYKSNEPLWEETFTFLIHNPRSQELEVEVKDAKHECSLGTLTLPLTCLLEAEEMTLDRRFPLKNSAPSSTLKLKVALRVLCVEKEAPSADNPNAAATRPSASDPLDPALDTPLSSGASNYSQGEGLEGPHPGSPMRLGGSGLSTSNLALSGSQQYLGHKESTPSIASDISNPLATQELQQRLHQLQNGSLSHFPLGEVQLTLRHCSQRNKLIVVVHGCRNLISFTDSGSDPYVRLYLLPDKRRSGRRKTHTLKKTLNPVYDQTFEFSVSIVELHRRTLDVAVKNGGGLLSKHKGLLGKVLVDLSYEDISKVWTQWYELTEDGSRRQIDA